MNNYLNAFFDPDSEGINLLQKIFKGRIDEGVRDRLKEVFTVTENYWNENVERIGEVSVKYLLICEAPPWTEPGENPKYFYNYSQDSSPLLTIVHGAFFEESNTQIKSYVEKLEELTHAGVLLIDSLPYSMKYSSRQRRSKAYLDLLKLSMQEYTIHKLHTSGLILDPEIRISLGFNINGQRIVESFPKGLPLQQDGQLVPIANDMISTSGAGFLPHREKLRKIFGLSMKT